MYKTLHSRKHFSLFPILFALTWFLISRTSVLAPLLLKLMLKDLGSPLPGEPGVVEAKLAHLHVVLASQQQDRVPAWEGETHQLCQ